MKQILIESKEWFDRVNGNSYFSSRVEIDGSEVAVLPFQYGYGSHDVDMVNAELHKLNIVNSPRHDNGSRDPLWRWCDDHKVQLKTIKHERCLKRDVVAWGEQ